jgi:transketolase
MNLSPTRPMRDLFIETLCNRMAADSSIWFLAADLGSPALDRMRLEFPQRCINVGIAEQNLVNVATGLALEGQTVYGYAIAPFISMRAYEQVRVNLSVSSQVRPVNVNLIGVGGGVSYQVSGPTHHCLEDLSIMRLLPNMTVFSPSDAVLAAAFVDYSIAYQGPKYLRFDGKALPVLYRSVDQELLATGFCELVSGSAVCLVSTGYMTQRAVRVANEHGGIGVVDLFMLKPFDQDKLFSTLSKYRHVITMEEAFINGGGLDCAIASLLSERRSSITLDRIGFNDRYVFELGSRDHLHALNGMDEAAILQRVHQVIGECST